MCPEIEWRGYSVANFAPIVAATPVTAINPIAIQAPSNMTISPKAFSATVD